MAEFQRIVRRADLDVLDLASPVHTAAPAQQHAPSLEKRQEDILSGISSFFEADPTTTTTEAQTTTSASPTTTSAEPTTTTTSTPLETTTTTTRAPDSDTSTTTSSRTTTTSRDQETTSSTSDSSSSSSTAAADTTVVSVVTPTTVIVVGTSTITSALDPITSSSTRALSASETAGSGSSSGLSSGAKIGIGVGAGVGGALVLAILAFACLGFGRRRKNKDEAIVWPAIADSSALYPEPVHNTRAGFGVGDDDEAEELSGGSHGLGMAEVGAGAAGIGAGAGMLGRYGSNASQHQPTLPSFPPSVYADQGYNGYYGAGSGEAPENSSAYTGYSTQTPSQHSHTPLAPGPASVGYTRSQDRHTPSPPRTQFGGGSADGHAQEGGSHLPFPGEAEENSPTGARPVSPTPRQVGDAFGPGYDESSPGRWRLSVVNDDPRDRD
ncbi:hypothetical protein JCM8547_009286 [Rhodosporidiobolus lusitaniae]